jgi:hypothetical protein
MSPPERFRVKVLDLRSEAPYLMGRGSVLTWDDQEILQWADSKVPGGPILTTQEDIMRLQQLRTMYQSGFWMWTRTGGIPLKRRSFVSMDERSYEFELHIRPVLPLEDPVTGAIDPLWSR